MKSYYEYMCNELRSIVYMMNKFLAILTVIILLIGFTANDSTFINLGIFNSVATLLIFLSLRFIDWQNNN